jgi:2-deoxy-D-gluconate 3-dehydrogenase
MDLLNLSGKVAIVTGGSSGIGEGIVKRFKEAGADVVVADLDTGYDVSKKEDVQRLVSQCERIDILVNNAGIYPNIPFLKMTSEDFMKVIEVNLKGAFLCTKYVSEKMISQGQGGKIINITSVDALHPSMAGLSHYDASKHGLWGFTKAAALELAPHKIWVNAIAPGPVATHETSGADPKIMEAFLAKIPMHRMGETDEIGKVALFLVSDMSSYMTGSQIVVDGGVLLS